MWRRIWLPFFDLFNYICICLFISWNNVSFWNHIFEFGTYTHEKYATFGKYSFNLAHSLKTVIYKWISTSVHLVSCTIFHCHYFCIAFLGLYWLEIYFKIIIFKLIILFCIIKIYILYVLTYLKMRYLILEKDIIFFIIILICKDLPFSSP